MADWTRASLETHLTVLTARHEGRELVDAITGFAATLTDDERLLLQEILLTRAKEEGAYDYALSRRIDERRWHFLRRRPDEPGQR